jgi:hypothetical protein
MNNKIFLNRGNWTFPKGYTYEVGINGSGVHVLDVYNEEYRQCASYRISREDYFREKFARGLITLEEAVLEIL